MLRIGVGLLAAGVLAAPATAADVRVVVAADGSGSFKTVQEAVAAAGEYCKDHTIIHIKAGKYEGPITVPKSKPKITFEGEGAETTIITWDHNVFDPHPSASHIFNPGVYIQADDFKAENLTMENDSGDHGQALAVAVDGDRVVFEGCRLLGWQDTLFINTGRQYFKNCYIEGRVDFIYGNGTALFDNCEIHSKNGGFITAANTSELRPYGFVFLNCKLTGSPDPWVNPATGKAGSAPGALAYLGRPWGAYASVAYINCEMDDHIRPEGWSNWGNAENEKTARYAEYGSRNPDGSPVDRSERVPWARRLSADEAAQYTISNVLGGGWEAWDPNAPEPKPGDVVTLSAKEAKINGSNARLENNGANIGYWNNTDTTFAWQADMQPGVYRVGLSYAIDAAPLRSEIQVQVGDKTFKLTPPATSGWDDYQTIGIGEVEVTQAGRVPVVISALSQKGSFILNVSHVVLKKK